MSHMSSNGLRIILDRSMREKKERNQGYSLVKARWPPLGLFACSHAIIGLDYIYVVFLVWFGFSTNLTLIGSNK